MTVLDHQQWETARMRAVSRYNILDTPADGTFDRIARLAASWFGTPIATVTIVDEDRIWFKAAHGLEGVRQIDRDPGLCASAILCDRPYVVADARTDPRTAQNPLVQGELGVRFYAAAPITTADGYRLGTVNVLDTRPREVSAADLSVLEDLASVVMDQLELRLSALATVRAERDLRLQAERDRHVLAELATTLQRTLLPPSLPAIEGIELACHYHAASSQQVGGDFYDVFHLGDDRWAFFLGDVEGHGPVAASVTSLIRYTLRAAAVRFSDPRLALAELNTVLLLDPQQHRFCTVLLGIIEPNLEGREGARVTLATGGHPPALLLRRSGAVCAAVGVRGMLVGALPEARFGACTVDLEPGETLLLYTDGLTEARPDGREIFGEENVVAFLSARVPDATPIRLVAELSELIPSLRAQDDIALLAVGVPR